MQRGRNLEVEAKSLSISRPASDTHLSRSASPDLTRNTSVTGSVFECAFFRFWMEKYLVNKITENVYNWLKFGICEDIVILYSAMDASFAY